MHVAAANPQSLTVDALDKDLIERERPNMCNGYAQSVARVAAEIAAAYEKTDFEQKLLLPDRVNAMCLDLFTRMLAADPERGPHQKTIIFCARDRHADDVAAAVQEGDLGIARELLRRHAAGPGMAEPPVSTSVPAETVVRPVKVLVLWLEENSRSMRA